MSTRWYNLGTTEWKESIMYQIMQIEDFSERERKIFDQCVALSRRSDFRTFKHGAILFKKRIINTSYNALGRFTHFAQRFHGDDYYVNSLHAEMGTILNVPHSLTNGATVMVVRTNSSGNLKLSYPCPTCMGAMKFVGIKRVYFSIDNERIGILRLNDV